MGGGGFGGLGLVGGVRNRRKRWFLGLFGALFGRVLVYFGCILVIFGAVWGLFWRFNVLVVGGERGFLL